MDNYTKMTIYSKNKTFQYYLKNNGRITTDPKDPTLVFDVIMDLKYYQEEISDGDALAFAKSRLEKKYNNEIILIVRESIFSYFNASDWYDLLNTPIQYWIEDKNINSSISKITYKENDFISITLGTSRTRLTDKLKQIGGVIDGKRNI